MAGMNRCLHMHAGLRVQARARGTGCYGVRNRCERERVKVSGCAAKDTAAGAVIHMRTKLSVTRASTCIVVHRHAVVSS